MLSLPTKILQPSPVIASLPIIPGLQKRAPSALLSDAGTSLTSAFPIAIVCGLSFGSPVEHNPCLVFQLHDKSSQQAHFSWDLLFFLNSLLGQFNAFLPGDFPWLKLI